MVRGRLSPLRGSKKKVGHSDEWPTMRDTHPCASKTLAILALLTAFRLLLQLRYQYLQKPR